MAKGHRGPVLPWPANHPAPLRGAKPQRHVFRVVRSDSRPIHCVELPRKGQQLAPACPKSRQGRPRGVAAPAELGTAVGAEGDRPHWRGYFVGHCWQLR